VLDELVAAAVVARMSDPSVLDVFTPATPEVDLTALRAEAAALDQGLIDVMGQRFRKEINGAQLATYTTMTNDRLAEIQTALSEVAGVSPLTPLLGKNDVTQAWERLTLAKRKAVVSTLFVVTVLPTRELRSAPDDRHSSRDSRYQRSTHPTGVEIHLKGGVDASR
jgi:hypothetical protein